jgi:hypothetical protein
MMALLITSSVWNVVSVLGACVTVSLRQEVSRDGQNDINTVCIQSYLAHHLLITHYTFSVKYCVYSG